MAQKHETKRTNFILLRIYAIILLFFVAAWLQPFVPLSFLFRDTVVVASVPFYYGIFSNFGILLWCATAAITLFSAAVLFSTGKDLNFSTFLFHFGLFSLLLTFDDFFLLHEQVFPKILKLSETITFFIYGVTTIYLLLRFKKTILKTDSKIFLLTLLLLFLSIVLDKLLLGTGLYFKNEEDFLLEDGIKLLGIATWSFYFISISLKRIKLLIDY